MEFQLRTQWSTKCYRKLKWTEVHFLIWDIKFQELIIDGLFFPSWQGYILGVHDSHANDSIEIWSSDDMLYKNVASMFSMRSNQLIQSSFLKFVSSAVLTCRIFQWLSNWNDLRISACHWKYGMRFESRKPRDFEMSRCDKSAINVPQFDNPS